MNILKNIAVAVAVVAAVLLPTATAQAAGNASLTLSAGGSGATGGIATIAIYENGDNVNVVTAGLSYDQGQLQYLSVNAGQSAFASNASTRGGNGTVEVSRYATDENGPTVVSGNRLVAVVSFKVLGNSGATTVSSTGSTQIASNGADIWNGVISSATISMSAPVTVRATATPAPTPAPTPEPTPSPTPAATPTPAKKETAKAATTVEAEKSSKVLPLGLIVLLIGVIVAAYIYIRRRTEKSTDV